MRADLQLFEAWKRGDTSAGNELFQRHFESIRRFFANKVEPGEVEDLVQRTFVGCVEGKNRFEGRSSFRTYVFAVAHNILRESIRRRRRNEHVDFDAISVAEVGAGASSIVAHKREQRALLEALRSIPVDSQMALELYYWEQMSGPQLAEVFAVPENTARSRVRRAKKLLLDALRKQEQSDAVLKSTTENLDGWAKSVRALMPAGE